MTLGLALRYRFARPCNAGVSEQIKENLELSRFSGIQLGKPRRSDANTDTD